MAKRIAIITTWYPPQQSIAAQRMIAMAEYFSQHYQVTVFALDNRKHVVQRENIEVRYSSSYPLLEALKSNTADGAWKHKIKTALRIVLSKFIPSPMKRWKEATQADFVHQHQTTPFDLVISSYAPAEAHEVVLFAKKQFPSLPWIADMRDEMSANPFLSSEEKNRLRNVEIQVNDHAQALLAVSKPILQQFEELCPAIPVHLEIRNGFYHRFKRSAASVSVSEIFKIGYFGTFYGSIKPTHFFEAVQLWTAEHPSVKMEIHLFGVHHNFTVPSALQSRIIVHDRLPYEHAISTMAGMSVNLLLHPKNNRKGVYTGKLFDYISVQVPVLAMIDPDDVAADLIREFNCGYIAEFDDVAQNKNALQQAYLDWTKQIQRIANDSQVATLHRDKQLEKFVELIEKINL